MRSLIIIFFITSGFNLINEDGEALKYLRNQAVHLGLSEDDLSELSVNSAHYDRQTNLHFYYIQQRREGHPIEGALAILVKTKEKGLKIINQSFIKDVNSILPAIASIDSTKALKKAEAYCNANKELTGAKIKSQQLVWMRENSEWHLTFDLRIDKGDSHWRLWSDAETGQIRRSRNLVKECSFGQEEHIHQALEILNRDLSAPATSVGESYLVFPWPVESPQHGLRELVVAPADPASSPFGWHDVDGIEGPEYTDTRGNNVFAQSDADGFDISEDRPNAGADLDFSYQLDLEQVPSESSDATVTNLFYWNNLNHDIFYHYGFDESAGNFQVKNYQPGGSESDQVFADAQDGSDLNNARFFAAEDGIPARMQMYLWSTQLFNASIEINIDNSAPLIINAVESAFSDNNKLRFLPVPEAEIVLANDATGNSHLVCLGTSIANRNELQGKIALIDRGTCFFIEKVKRLQDLGVVAVIVGNNVADDPFAMGGEDNSITIPAVMISLDQANLLKSQLGQEKVICRINRRDDDRFLDSALDNLIITHEYGHGISIRLIGGRNNIDCLDNGEQMGEGWSDYFGLMLTTDWSTAKAEDKRGIGTYVTNESITGTGLRQYPYSADRTINPMHYDDVKESVVPHDVGAIWCSMLWDMTWNIVESEGISSDIYNGRGGNNIALQLVMTGLKLTSCYPGFVDGRDAILQADSLLYGGKHQYQIWKAFALRGVGFSANQESTFFTFDGKSSMNLPEQFRTQIDFFSASDQTNHINIDFRSLQEYDNESFLVQRSIDKINFETINFFDGKILELNPRSFHYEDHDVEPGQIYYYRLLNKDIYSGLNIIALDSATLIPVTDVLIFPNPFHSTTSLKVDRSISGPVQINCFSASGQLLTNQTIDASQLYTRYRLNFNNLNPGVYFLEIISEGSNHRRKIIVQ